MLPHFKNEGAQRCALVALAVVLAFPAVLAAQESEEGTFESTLLKREVETRKRLEAERKLNAALFIEMRAGLLNDDRQVRLQSLRTIMDMKEVDKELLIIDMLDDRDEAVRLEVVKYFARAQTTPNFKALLSVLEDESLAVRTELIKTVMEYCRAGYEAQDLMHGLLEDKQPSVRKLMLEELAKVPDDIFVKPRYFDAIRDSMYDNSLELRLLAFGLVRRFPLEQTHDYLESALQDQQTAVREVALDIVGGHTGLRAIKLIADRLTDPFSHVRSKAIDLLADRLDEDVVRILDNHILTEGDFELRLKVLEAVSTLRGPLAVGIISRSLDDPVVKVRRRAAELLSAIHKTVILDEDYRTR
ncbi:MAG: HEAT repeat domain-containing protein [Planctomycetota bacterium]